ncbi:MULTISPECIES: YitT family protein [Neobacillus]|uniref:YitT family protein n=1 Tax=Neobacillus rhizophilus TaxID=2833579 RepID=A0A942U4J7_9BACI|nr:MULTISPECIES: YitT family protein [Neobacillus]MBS4213080.1 YitT family protein [Neobacillus rhizophilus]
MKKTAKDILYIFLGALIFAIGVNYFTIPNHLSEGGILGITIVAHYLFGWSPGVVNFVLNAVLILIGYKFFDKRAFVYTLVSLAACSGFLFLTEDIGRKLTEDTLLASLFAGLLVGAGLGFIFRAGGTSGGTTILARLANQFFGWSMGKAMLIIDIVVVAGSIFIIGLEKAMFTLLIVYVGAKAIDFIVEGLDERVAVLVISNSPEAVLAAITEKMSRGLTVLEGHGGYTGQKKEVLYIVINKQEIVQLKNTIACIDPNAYVTVHNVHEMMGKGYKAG